MAGRPGGVRPDRHHGRRHQRDLFGLPGRGGRHRVQLPRAAAGVLRARGCPALPLHRPRQPLLPHPRGRRQGRPRINTPRSAAPSISSASSTSLPIRPRRAAAPSAPSAPSRTASSRNWRWRRSPDGRSRKPLHRRHLPARPQPPLHHPARTRRQRLRAPRTPRPDRRHPLSPHRPHGRPRQHRALRKARASRSPLPRPDTTTSRPRSGSTSIQTEPSPLFHGPRCLARYNANGEPVETPTRQAA